MRQNISTDGSRKKENGDKREDNRVDDDPQLRGQTHCGDHRIYGEDNIQKHNLGDNGQIGPGPGSQYASGPILEGDGVMNLPDGLEEQKKPTAGQN